MSPHQLGNPPPSSRVRGVAVLRHRMHRCGDSDGHVDTGREFASSVAVGLVSGPLDRGRRDWQSIPKPL